MTQAVRPRVVVGTVDGGPHDGGPLIGIAADLDDLGQVLIVTEDPIDAVRLIAALMDAVRLVAPTVFDEFFVESP